MMGSKYKHEHLRNLLKNIFLPLKSHNMKADRMYKIVIVLVYLGMYNFNADIISRRHNYTISTIVMTPGSDINHNSSSDIAGHSNMNTAINMVPSKTAGNWELAHFNHFAGTQLVSTKATTSSQDAFKDFGPTVVTKIFSHANPTENLKPLIPPNFDKSPRLIPVKKGKISISHQSRNFPGPTLITGNRGERRKLKSQVIQGGTAGNENISFTVKVPLVCKLINCVKFEEEPVANNVHIAILVFSNMKYMSSIHITNMSKIVFFFKQRR